MPPVLNQINGGRWDNFLRRMFPIKEQSIAPVIASELVGMVIVQEWEPELFKLRDEALAIAYTEVGAVAAQLGHVQLFNPAGSASLITLEKVIFFVTVDSTLQIAYEPGIMAGSIQAASAFRDQRFSPTPNIGITIGQPRFVSSVPVIGTATISKVQVILAPSLEWKLDMVISPGQSVVVRHQTVNRLLGVTWFWRERSAEPSELQ